MTVCFNILNLTVPPDTADRVLSKAFENCEIDDWGFSPQNFSFKPFLEVYEDAKSAQVSSESIWTNWIERQASENAQEKLLIEFETESEPPMHVIDAFIKWLDQEKLTYELSMKYRLENDRFEGEVKAQGSH